MLRSVTRNLQYSWICYILIIVMFTYTIYNYYLYMSFNWWLYLNQLSEEVESKNALIEASHIIYLSGLTSLPSFVVSNIHHVRTRVCRNDYYFKYITKICVKIVSELMGLKYTDIQFIWFNKNCSLDFYQVHRIVEKIHNAYEAGQYCSISRCFPGFR